PLPLTPVLALSIIPVAAAPASRPPLSAASHRSVARSTPSRIASSRPGRPVLRPRRLTSLSSSICAGRRYLPRRLVAGSSHPASSRPGVALPPPARCGRNRPVHRLLPPIAPSPPPPPLEEVSARRASAGARVGGAALAPASRWGSRASSPGYAAWARIWCHHGSCSKARRVYN
ncbi:hypothetical protein U9M48_009127, partial [Paspalum notatum var. saurae]